MYEAIEEKNGATRNLSTKAPQKNCESKRVTLACVGFLSRDDVCAPQAWGAKMNENLSLIARTIDIKTSVFIANENESRRVVVVVGRFFSARVAIRRYHRLQIDHECRNSFLHVFFPIALQFFRSCARQLLALVDVLRDFFGAIRGPGFVMPEHGGAAKSRLVPEIRIHRR